MNDTNCLNSIRITGPKETLIRLHDTIMDIISKQGFGGPRGLHFLLLALGYPEDDARTLDTREDFCPDFLSFQKIDTTLSDDVLSFGTISDFDIKKEAWAAVRQTLPGIEIHYLSVTNSLGRIVTNDTEHRFFDIYVHYSRDEDLSR